MFLFNTISMTLRKIRIYILGAFVFHAFGNVLMSQTKPQLAIHVQVEYPNYKNQGFNRPDLGLSVNHFEDSASTAMRGWLAERFPFLECTAGPASDSLLFRLRADDLETAVQVSPLLKLGNGTSHTTLPFNFRSGDAFEDMAPVSPEAFVEELKSNFFGWVNTREQFIVQDLFAHVKLCDEAIPKPQIQDWVLPFTKQDLMIDDSSRFQIKTVINQGAKNCDFETVVSGTFPELQNSIRCSYNSLINIECLNKVLESIVEGVYLIKFKRLNLLSQPADADDFPFQ